MPPDLTPITTALEQRAWYPFAAAVLTLLIGLWRKVQPLVWDKIPKRWQWVPAVLIAGAAGFVHATLTGATLKTALCVAGYAMITGGLTSIGIVHTYKRIAGKVPEEPDVPEEA